MSISTDSLCKVRSFDSKEDGIDDFDSLDKELQQITSKIASKLIVAAQSNPSPVDSRSSLSRFTGQRADELDFLEDSSEQNTSLPRPIPSYQRKVSAKRSGRSRKKADSRSSKEAKFQGQKVKVIEQISRSDVVVCDDFSYDQNLSKKPMTQTPEQSVLANLLKF